MREKMTATLKYASGFIVCFVLAIVAMLINILIPGDIVGSGVITILLGMALFG